MSHPEPFAETDPIEHRTMAAQVYERLSFLLISGQVAPGAKLSLRALSQTFGCSMMPTREAVTRLVTEGALEVMRNRAARVPVIRSDQFRDLTRVRSTIEGHAAAEAARRRSDTDLARIAAARDAFRLECSKPSPDPALAVAYNQAFHFAVYEAAGSPTLMSIIRGLWLKAGPVLNLDLRANSARRAGGHGVGFHALVVAALERGDPEGAASGIAGDIEGTAAFILQQGSLQD